MTHKTVGGVLLPECPHCKGEELIDIGYDRESGYYEKQCPKCNRTYRRIKGYGHKWFEVGLMDL